MCHPAANPHGSLTPADAPLIDAENLLRQPDPPQTMLGRGLAHLYETARRKFAARQTEATILQFSNGERIANA